MGAAVPARLLYQFDSYLREFEAVVTRVAGDRVFLDQTCFHPRPSGGLDADRGWLVVGGRRVGVVDVVVEGGDVAHVVEDSSLFSAGCRVHGVIDWGRRYAMMRMHTAGHVLSAVLYRRFGARVTGCFVSADRSRFDFEVGVEDWRGAVRSAVEEANDILSRCIEVRVYWLPREDALRIPGVVKLADRLPPSVDRLRIVEIPGVDVQADGGPHVRNTCEVGSIVLLRLESRGRRRKRLYYRVSGGSGD